jgi:hypothetical protein
MSFFIVWFNGYIITSEFVMKHYRMTALNFCVYLATVQYLAIAQNQCTDYMLSRANPQNPY